MTEKEIKAPTTESGLARLIREKSTELERKIDRNREYEDGRLNAAMAFQSDPVEVVRVEDLKEILEDIHDELEKYNGNLYSLTTAYHTLASREEHYKALSEELQRKLDEPLPPLKEQLKAQARRWLDKGVEYLAVAAITLAAVGIIAGVSLLII